VFTSVAYSTPVSEYETLVIFGAFVNQRPKPQPALFGIPLKLPLDLTLLVWPPPTSPPTDTHYISPGVTPSHLSSIPHKSEQKAHTAVHWNGLQTAALAGLTERHRLRQDEGRGKGRRETRKANAVLCCK
jgi:hypothetical protein